MMKVIKNILKKIPGLRKLVWKVRGWNNRRKLKEAIKKEEVTLPKHFIIKKDMELPSICTIIPTYRENLYLEKAVSSVLNQNYPNDKLRVIVSVNGGDEGYFQLLKKKYSDDRRVLVVYTSKKGAAAGRNYAVQFLNEDCVTFLDDDDYFEVNYLRNMAIHMTDSVTLVFGGFLDYYEKTNNFSDKNYINVALKDAGEGIGKDYEIVSGLLSTICGKLYKRELWERFDKIDETVKNTEDVIFWARNCEKIDGFYYVTSYHTGMSYVRRIVDNSLSRPDEKKYFEFYVVDRLTVIERLSNCLLDAKTEKGKRFIKGKIKIQTNFIIKAIPKSLAIEAERLYNLILKCNSIFLNRSQLSTENAIAFCHNFSPTADPSAYVATKRLSQISNIEGSLNWNVFRGDMRNCRKLDLQFENYYGCFQYSNCTIVGKNAAFNEKAQYIWGQNAFEAAEKNNINDVKVIYSRSMWAGSHIAANLYKKNHPKVRWYAEFSDPVYMQIGNRPRNVSQNYKGQDEHLNNFWFDIEKIVYENADFVIFTNENQRDYMLSYFPKKDICKKIREKSLIMNHPAIPHEYCNLFKANLELNIDYINIAYFGSFYSNRRADDLWSLLNNEKVVLHLFISDSGDMKDIGQIPERVHIHETLNYFEFLNAASRMDYLVLVDTSFEIPELNPYLPSKLADYLTAQTPILAFVNEGSPLSKIQNEMVIKIKSGQSFDVQLNKKGNHIL